MAVTAPYALAKRDLMYRTVRESLANGATCTRPELYRILHTVHASTANRVIRELAAAGQIVSMRMAGSAQPHRYAATTAALLAVAPTARPLRVRVRLHDGGRYRILTAPCDRDRQGQVLVGMSWREELGAFTSSRGATRHWPLAQVESVYSSVAADFVPVTHCDRVPLAARPAFVPTSTVGSAVVALLTAHGPLSVGELCELLPHIRKSVLKAQIVRMATEQTLARSGRRAQQGRTVTTWAVGPVGLNERPSRGRPSEIDTWTPEPWIHPIRRRLLGLPVASAEFDVPLDFSHPMRKAA